MEVLKRFATAGVTVALVVAVAMPASAATADGSFTATCDPGSYGYATNGTVYQHSTKGTLSVKQTASSPTITSSVKVTSQNGNSTSDTNVSDGGTASWTNVLAGQYKVYARSSSGVNCNGAWPGKGNYKFSYKITY
jgi:hypothetical protein